MALGKSIGHAVEPNFHFVPCSRNKRCRLFPAVAMPEIEQPTSDKRGTPIGSNVDQANGEEGIRFVRGNVEDHLGIADDIESFRQRLAPKLQRAE
jgi:hypothetical protein